jgi:hypothetical protein
MKLIDVSCLCLKSSKRVRPLQFWSITFTWQPHQSIVIHIKHFSIVHFFVSAIQFSRLWCYPFRNRTLLGFHIGLESFRSSKIIVFYLQVFKIVTTIMVALNSFKNRCSSFKSTETFTLICNNQLLTRQFYQEYVSYEGLYMLKIIMRRNPLILLGL